MSRPVTLGIDPRTHREVQLPLEARRLGTYMIGRQGSGKTNLLIQIALTDIANGHGVCVLSPHADLTQDLLARIPQNRRDDVIVFDPTDTHPIGVNVFDWQGPSSTVPMEKIADDVVFETFKRLWIDSWGPRMEEMMYNVARTILYAQQVAPQHRPTLAEFAEVVGWAKDTTYRQYLLDHIHQHPGYPANAIRQLLKFWQEFDGFSERRREEIASSTLNKARPFASSELLAPVIGQGQLTRLDFKQVLSEDKILLVDFDVNDLGSGNVELLGSLIVGRLFVAAISRELEPPPKPFHVIADEFGFFATPAFAALQDQARKFGVTVLVAHQRRGQLDSETRDATLTAGNWIIFSVNAQDAEQLAPGFDSEPPSPQLRSERLDLALAQRPWGELKRQSPEEVSKLVHQLEQLLFVATWITLNFPGSPARDYLEWEQRGLADVKGVGLTIWGFPSQSHRQNLEIDLNRVLYLMMAASAGDEIEPLLLSICARLYRFHPSPDASVEQSYIMPSPDGEAPMVGGTTTAAGKGGWILAAPQGDPPLGDDWHAEHPQALLSLRGTIWQWIPEHKSSLSSTNPYRVYSHVTQLNQLTWPFGSIWTKTYVKLKKE